MTTSIGGLLAGCFSRLTYAKESRKLPRVLLLGDSISVGYTDFVIGILLGKVDVYRPLNNGGGYENCEGTTKAVKKLDAWLGDGRWDLIHFNFGLHDLKHVDARTGKKQQKPRRSATSDIGAI